MTRSPGTRFGPYEIVSLLGVGGMGHVYKARDTRLDRVVAVKLLPPDLAERRDRRRRFEAEARAISSLSHPHICALYDVGDEDGQVFLVMEYLEGETLDDRIARGPLPAREVLQFASQIASALDHAHRAQIIHRDLKPSNVMLTESGVKLLDFGLARGPALAGVPTASTVSFNQEKLTAEGAIVGTFPYMAPEQVEGKEADQRTDIFAFGTMLYEMATGHRAFDGASQASLIASILTEQPPPVSSTRAARRADGLPEALDHVVERCLAKNPDERWQTARDLRAELSWIVEGGSRSAVRRPVLVRNRTREVFAWATALVAIVAAVTWTLFRPANDRAEVTRFVVNLPQGSTIPRVRGDATYLAASPDGRHIAFVATIDGQEGLWVQSFDSTAPRAVVAGQSILSPFWSPDSRFIGFFATGEGLLKKVEITGGPARTICATRMSGRALWHSDGTILFSEFRQGIFRVRAEGGEPTQVTRVNVAEREINHFWPSVLPDGRHFLYMTTRLDESGRRATPIVYAASLDSDERTEVMRVNSGVMYTQSGRVLYVHEGAVLAHAFDLNTRRLTGEPVRVAEGLDYTRSTGAAAFSASSNVLAYTTGGGALELIWFDRQGREAGSIGGPQRFGNIRLSPNGDRLAAEVIDARLGTADIWIYDVARGAATRLTTDVNDERLPTWSADGRRIAFGSDRGTGSDASGDFFHKSADGMGEEEPFFVRVGAQFIEDWSPNGRLIVYREDDRQTGSNLSILPFGGEQTEPRSIMATRYDEWGPRFSPDSQWIACVSDESGRNEVYVAPVEGRGAKIPISTAGGIAPRWRSDGKELFYLSSDARVVMSVPITLTPALKTGTPVRLFAINSDSGVLAAGRVRNVTYDVTPDGQRFLFGRATGEPARISIVLNWPRLLQQ